MAAADEGAWLLHGHTHLADQRVHLNTAGVLRQLHVGWDAWRRPVSLAEVTAILASVPPL